MNTGVTKGTRDADTPNDAQRADERDEGGKPLGFALGAALSNLARQPREFHLTSAAADGLVIRLLVTPMPDQGLPRPERARYRRTVCMLRDGRPVNEYSSVACVDLLRRTMVGIEFGGIRTEILRAESLPEFAAIGDRGRFFDHAVVAVSGSAKPSVGSSVTWSLEPWDRGRALWCNRVRSAAGGSPSEEGYVLRPDGTIDGALIGGWAADPTLDGAQRSFRFVSSERVNSN